MFAFTLNLHTTMTTLEVETECRGTLVATLQPIQEFIINGIDTQIFAGHIVPKDKSTGKVFFNFMLNDEKHECELLPKKGLHAYNKLTDKDEDIIAEICYNLKETIYEAKKEELGEEDEAEEEKVKTPAKKTLRRKSTEILTQLRSKSSEKPKSRAKAKITPAGKLGQEIAGLGLQIRGLKRKKLRATNLYDEYEAESRKNIEYLHAYGKSNKKAYGDIKDMLNVIDQITNLRETWSGMTHIVSEINPKSKKNEGNEHSCLHDYAQLLRTTAKYIDSKSQDVEAIDTELKEKIEEFHKKSRQRTDLMLGDFVEGEDFEINDLEGVELFYE